MSKKGKILAIDFGHKNTGLAFCDVDRTMVFPGGVLKGYNSINELSESLRKYCLGNDISTILFGIPVNVEHSSEQEERYKRIGISIKNFLTSSGFYPDFNFVDESFSSFNAEKFMKENHVKGLTDHEMAAMKILQNFLSKF